MSDPEPTTQPLLRASSQQTEVNVGAPAQGGRSTRAYKVAGITLLACVLVVSQAMIAYFLLSQRNDIKSLEEQSSDLKEQLSKGRSVSGSMRMHSAMNVLPMMTDEGATTGGPGKADPLQATQCNLEAAGKKAVQVPGFRPDCDERGLYRPQQCYMQQCWCVNPASGEQIPGSVTDGPARCGRSALSGRMSSVLSMANTDV